MKKIIKYKIHWYKLIPFVIAELENPEYEKLLPDYDKFSELFKMYNSNGNWYVLEGLDYFWWHKEWWTDSCNEILFNDSIHIWFEGKTFEGKTDEERYDMLIDSAKSGIDHIWNKFFKKLKIIK